MLKRQTLFIFSVCLILFCVFAQNSIASDIHATAATSSKTSTKNLPKVKTIVPLTAVKNADVTYSALVSDNEVLVSCDLYVNGKWEKSMTIKRDVTYTTFKFTKNGTYKLYAKCVDTDGNTASGKQVSVVVSSGSSHVSPGNLIKAGCSDNADDAICSAVYYFGADGKRHAFPNENVYYSWYNNFDNLVIVSASVLSDLPLGKNITYRPGKRLVKFFSNKVYAVSYAGLLRPIANAEIAESIFGEDWVSLIENEDDIFFENYRIGATIESSNDFSWRAAESEMRSIESVLR